MGGASGSDVEQLLRTAAFSDPAHKEALREKLFHGRQELSWEELGLVAGGAGADTATDDFSALRKYMAES